MGVDTLPLETAFLMSALSRESGSEGGQVSKYSVRPYSPVISCPHFLRTLPQ
jgi:hypothetical protein